MFLTYFSDVRDIIVIKFHSYVLEDSMIITKTYFRINHV